MDRQTGMLTEVTTYHLEMAAPDELRPAPSPRVDVALVQAKLASPQFNRFLYTAVGANWYWTERLNWSYQTWIEYVDRPELETWVMYVAGTPAGYYELERCPNGSVNIAYFGLLPEFIGQGLGGYLLTCAITRAWQMGANRVWLHTCTLDHEHALANYQARGLRIHHQAIVMVHLAEIPLQNWGVPG